jgi:hypothetical protein
MRHFIIIFLSIAALDIILALLLMKNDLSADGFLEAGYPFIVYRTTSAKMDPGMAASQFYLGGLLGNLAIILIVSAIIFLFIRKRSADVK